jgi:hypothetical protein
VKPELLEANGYAGVEDGRPGRVVLHPDEAQKGLVWR